MLGDSFSRNYSIKSVALLTIGRNQLHLLQTRNKTVTNVDCISIYSLHAI
jgi:hypothetical protein